MFHDRIQSVDFSIFTSEEIKQLSVKRITSIEIYDTLGHPITNGLADPMLGTTGIGERCASCGQSSVYCPGHFGHVELPLPLYHPMFFQLMMKLLTGSCFTCHRLMTTISETHLFIRQAELLEKGLLTEAKELESLYNSTVSNNSAGSATEIDLQRTICNELDTLFDRVVLSQPESKIKFTNTKNLVKDRLDLINHFIKKKLTSPKKKCPHCKFVKRKVKHEYQTRIYFKSVGSAAAKAAKNVKLPSSVSEIKRQKDEVLEEDDDDEESEYEDEDEEENEEDADKRKTKNDDTKNVTTDINGNYEQNLTSDEFITAEEVKNHFIQLWKTESKAMKCLLGSHKVPDGLKKVTTPEIFFLDLVMVTPVKFRPSSAMTNMQIEHPQTANLSKILITSKLVEGILQKLRDGDEEFIPFTLNKLPGQRGNASKPIPGKNYKEQLNNAWSLLQSDVNRFMDSSLDKINSSPNPGVKQLLEKKEGLFRKHMMGKRVNYACRSVISPDPFINTDEIGVPLVFASKLTYPQPVTPLNLKQLEEMVVNGPGVYPGAVMIEFEDGRIMKIPDGPDNKPQRVSLAKKLLSSNIPNFKCANKKVYRHLLNGDVMLLNRQPTLHRPSIMAHKAKVLPNERTLRLHYANCKSYNADFDGDEMNAHFPQSELGRAEAYNLVSTNFNYLSPKDGKPLHGLIQDHVISGVRLTSRNTLLEREEYQQLIFNGFIDKPGRIKLLPPCIIKPKPLWSGKQVFSTILLNLIPKGNIPLNMTGNKAKVSDSNWPKEKAKKNSPVKEITDPFLLESQVIIQGGELMTGILDKTQYGSTAFSLVHCVYEIYGGEIAGKLLSVIARLFTAYLQYTGFTLGVHAILVADKAEKKRRDMMDEGRQCGDSSAIEAMNLDPDTDSETLRDRLQKAHLTNQGIELALLDLSMKSRTDSINNKINSVCMRGLIQKFPSNALQMMVQSGAKGSTVNTMQISCLLGQIELEGRRPPLSMSGRSLPSFQPYDTSPRAGGFVDGRFLTGIRPQEYFFHCMAGREGLIDTAVKTSRSGYLQRCLIKHLEALFVQYDMTVRDGDGSVVQFLYGDDGIDVLKCQYLQDNQFKTVIDNQKVYVSILKPNEVSQVVDLKKAKKIQKKQDKWLQKNEKPFAAKYSFERPSPFLLYEKESRRKVQKKYPSKKRNQHHRTQADLKLFDRWHRSDGPTKESYASECQPILDPILSMYNPSCYFGGVSELFRKNVKDYMNCDPDHRLVDDDEDDEEPPKGGKMSKDAFEPMMMIKYMKSLVQPGEAVGLLAAQSIGEPSTQMTLNTFHFAGRGEMNVTLGIPRLREILMTATEEIRTPQMEVLVKQGMGTESINISKLLTKVTLMDVLENLSVTESVEKDEAGESKRQFKIKFKMLPSYAYEDMTNVSALEILTFMETLFFRKLSLTIIKFIQHKKSKTFLSTKTVREENPNKNGEETEEGSGAAQPEDEPDDLADLSDEDAENDGGADVAKGRSRRTQFTSYDNPEDREQELHEDDEEQGNSIEDILAEDEPSKVDDQKSGSSSRSQKLLSEDNRKSRAIRIGGTFLADYTYDSQSNEWCEATYQLPLNNSKLMMINIVEKLAEKSVIHEAPGIHRAISSESQSPSDNGRHRLKCEGVNIQELWKYPDVLDLETLYSNNIHKIAQTYGIEAARRALIKEVQDVFKVYGIAIDPRHLSLIADYMTFEGVYKPFNRHAIYTNPFPFQKMSFETSTTFLKSAAAHGLTDNLGSPSSRIIVGRVINQGTGMVDLLPKLTV